MKLEDIIDIALGQWCYNPETKEKYRIMPIYQFNFIKREIKIRDSVRPDKIMILRRLLKKSGNEDINIVVGEPNI